MTHAREPIPVYLFVVWHRGLPELDVVQKALRERFAVLRQFDVVWRPCDYIRNFAAFYGWKSFSMWYGKRNRAGTGVFRAIVVRDEHPAWREVSAGRPPELMDNANVLNLKYALREAMRHSNVVHASINEAETRQNLQALTGHPLEAFLARTDLDGSVSTLDFPGPMKYVAYPYADVVGKGPRWLDGECKPNRMALFLLPRCGVPTIFSFSFRIFGIFSFAFCIGTIKMGFRQSIQ